MSAPAHVRVVAWLLVHANADPGIASQRRDFYALKDRLLKRWGRVVGDDVQEIVDRCWGYYDDGRCLGRGCGKCGGSGVFSRRRVLLERWEIAGRVFHRPVGPYYGDRPADIQGRIVHEPWSHSRASVDARLWLALLFDRRSWWRQMRSSCVYGWQWRPMLALQAFVFNARAVWFPRLVPRRCYRCSRRFIPLTMSPYAMECRSCAAEMRAFPQLADDDLPF